MVGGSVCMYSSRSLQTYPLLDRGRVRDREVGSMSEYERRGPVSALLCGARCLRGPPPPPRGRLRHTEKLPICGGSTFYGLRRRHCYRASMSGRFFAITLAPLPLHPMFPAITRLAGRRLGRRHCHRHQHARRPHNRLAHADYSRARRRGVSRNRREKNSLAGVHRAL